MWWQIQRRSRNTKLQPTAPHHADWAFDNITVSHGAQTVQEFDWTDDYSPGYPGMPWCDQVCGSNGQEPGPAVDDVQCTSKTEDNSDPPALAPPSAPPPDTTPCPVHQSWNPWTFQYTSICLWYIWCDLDCFLRCFKNEISHCASLKCSCKRSRQSWQP